ncbi:hypothetical protein TSMEX_007271 [Taenia solium]|eukprot:TsM_001032200 transcript=TsM_001032200 gene=TsM_001032200
MPNAFYRGSRRSCHYDSGDCDDSEADNFKTRENGRTEIHQIPSHLTESSCYTIRMTSLPRHRPVTSNPTTAATTTTTSATPGIPPTAFAYLLSSSTPATVTAAVTAASGTVGSVNGVNDVGGGDFYLLPQSSASSVDASLVGQPVSAPSSTSSDQTSLEALCTHTMFAA